MLSLGKVSSPSELPTVLVSHVRSEPKLLAKIMPTLAEQASLAGEGPELDIAVAALSSFEALANSDIINAESHFIKHMSAVLTAASSKQLKIRTAAESAMAAILSTMSPNALQAVLPALFTASEVGVAWQTRALALKAVASLGDRAPQQLGFALTQVVPQVTLSLSDPQAEVSQAAYTAMSKACNVIGNRDIEHMTPEIVRSICNPEEVPEIMRALVGVTFVQSVQSPALAMVVPLLIRGLQSKVTATRRQSAVIIDNMSKLVGDPIDAEPFLPTLIPALQFAADAASLDDPEARAAIERASAQLQRLSNLCEEAKLLTKTTVDRALVSECIQFKAPVAAEFDVELAHIVTLACSLMLLKKFEVADWEEVQRYLAGIVGEAKAAEAIDAIRDECREMVTATGEPKEEMGKGGEEATTCTPTSAIASTGGGDATAVSAGPSSSEETTVTGTASSASAEEVPSAPDGASTELDVPATPQEDKIPAAKGLLVKAGDGLTLKSGGTAGGEAGGGPSDAATTTVEVTPVPHLPASVPWRPKH